MVEGPLPLVFALIDQDRQWAVDYLAAVAQWAELRHLPGRRELLAGLAQGTALVA